MPLDARSEFGVPACPPLSSSAAIDDDDEEFAEVRRAAEHVSVVACT